MAVREIDALLAATRAALPGKKPYDTPYYLVLGRPGSGRTTAVQRMHLDWSPAGALAGVGGGRFSAHLAAEALFIEPSAASLSPAAITELAAALRKRRPREPVDGILLVLSAADFADLEDKALEAYALELRAQLSAAEAGFECDVPTYLLLTRYDTLFGFAEAFSWGPERAKEEPFGFVLPEGPAGSDPRLRIREQLGGLVARVEAVCLSRLAADDPPEVRTRAFQHLAEARELFAKLGVVLETLATGSAFEKAPWLRALAVGSAVPGTGDRMRARLARFVNMGLAPPPAAASPRPGGLPFHAFMRAVVLPERELVPTRVRWRDDPLTVLGFAVGVLLLATALALALR